MEKRTLLIVVDVQNDFVTGSLGTKEAQAIIPFVRDFVQKAHDRGWEIGYTMDTHDSERYLHTQEGQKLPVKHCIINTHGWEIVDGVRVLDSPTLHKTGFGYNDWESQLIDEYCDRIIMLGLCTDICVITNALTLKSIYKEIPITVMAKGCAGTTPAMHEKALDVMRSCKIEICEGDDID